MATLILDIETAGKEWDGISGSAQKTLTKYLSERTDLSQEEKERELKALQNRLGLSPYTGQIVTLAMYDLERNLGVVYFVSGDQDDEFKDDIFDFRSATEEDMLLDFWEGAQEYDVFVTFNGRSFALPYLYLRSAALRVKPKVEISVNLYLLKQTFPYHIDLLDQFSLAGAVRPRPSLAVLCDMFGIEYEPEFGGEAVAEFFHQKKFRHLARHAATDVIAIKELYLVWKDYLAPLSFINNLEM